MNQEVFGKTVENVRKRRDIKLVTTNKRRNYLASEPNYHKVFFRKWREWEWIEMKKLITKMNQGSMSRFINTKDYFMYEWNLNVWILV